MVIIMKTNQLMNVSVGNAGQFQIEHKTQMGNLKQVWEIGNSYRRNRNLPAKDMKSWLRSKDLGEYVEALERSILGASEIDLTTNAAGTTISLAKQSELMQTRRGVNGGTWAHLYILLEAATYLDPDFKVQVYRTFVEGKLLQHRDESGDAYKAMNIAMDIAFPEQNEKARVARYITLANTIADYLDVPKGKGRWNKASYEQLEKRTKIEESLTIILRNGFARDFQQILTSIPNILG